MLSSGIYFGTHTQRGIHYITCFVKHPLIQLSRQPTSSRKNAARKLYQ